MVQFERFFYTKPSSEMRVYLQCRQSICLNRYILLEGHLNETSCLNFGHNVLPYITPILYSIQLFQVSFLIKFSFIFLCNVSWCDPSNTVMLLSDSEAVWNKYQRGGVTLWKCAGRFTFMCRPSALPSHCPPTTGSLWHFSSFVSSLRGFRSLEN